MKLGFSTAACPDWSLEVIAQKARDLEFDGVEIRVHPDSPHLSIKSTPAEAEAIGETFSRSGISIFSLMSYCRFAFVDEATVQINRQQILKLLLLAETMGAPFIRAFVGKVPTGSSHEDMVARVANALKPLAEEAARRNVKIGLETHDDWCFGENLVKIIEQVNNPEGLGIVYDVLACYERGIESWTETYRKVYPHLCYCHLRDGKLASGDRVLTLLGAGELPVSKILWRFERNEYPGYICFDWDARHHPELGDPQHALRHFSRKVRAFCANEVAR